jgi:hypothetical protein
MQSFGTRTSWVWALLLATSIAAFGTLDSQSATERKPKVDIAGLVPLNLPFSFERNAGQFSADARYMARSRGYNIVLGVDGATFEFKAASPECQQDLDRAHATPNHPHDMACYGMTSVPVRLRFIGANHDAEPEGQSLLQSYSNYLTGNDQLKWKTHVPNYGEVFYSGIYPGIDMVYYGANGQLEYDFVVAPHANAERISFSVEISGDSTRIHKAPNGDLTIPIGDKEAVLHKPRMFQGRSCREGGFNRTTSSCALLSGGGFNIRKLGNSAAEVSFEVPAYDHSQALIIDPIVSFSTFLGGNIEDSVQGMALDSSGNILLSGETTSTNYPVTRGALQPRFGGVSDVFLTKLSADGSQLIYSTYLGGSNAEYSHGIAVDSSGDIYLAGETYSSDFPLVNAYQSQNRSGSGFLSKLSADGSTLIYSTFLGGSVEGSVNGIVVDSSGEAIVAGRTYSVDFPVVNAFQGSHAADGGHEDAFLTKFSADGSSLIFSTYLGGNSEDIGTDVNVDLSGNIYVVGTTCPQIFLPRRDHTRAPHLLTAEASFQSSVRWGYPCTPPISHSAQLPELQ